MTSYKPNLATVHNHFSNHSFTLPKPLKPQLVPPMIAGNDSVSTEVPPTYSVIDVQSAADKVAGSSVSSF